MDTVWKTALWQQFGAAIDMLDNAIRACPERLWHGRLWSTASEPALLEDIAAFWYLSYHALFWLDFHLTASEESFAPPPPFTLSELDPAGVIPERAYTREELRSYLLHLRERCQTTIAGLTDDEASRPQPAGTSGKRPETYLELLLYSMRHVQEHAAQLNLFLGQNLTEEVPDWVGRVKKDI